MQKRKFEAYMPTHPEDCRGRQKAERRLTSTMWRTRKQARSLKLTLDIRWSHLTRRVTVQIQYELTPANALRPVRRELGSADKPQFLHVRACSTAFCFLCSLYTPSSTCRMFSVFNAAPKAESSAGESTARGHRRFLSTDVDMLTKASRPQAGQARRRNTRSAKVVADTLPAQNFVTFGIPTHNLLIFTTDPNKKMRSGQQLKIDATSSRKPSGRQLCRWLSNRYRHVAVRRPLAEGPWAQLILYPQINALGGARRYATVLITTTIQLRDAIVGEEVFKSHEHWFKPRDYKLDIFFVKATSHPGQSVGFTFTH